jgi:hypothetical protein
MVKISLIIADFHLRVGCTLRVDFLIVSQYTPFQEARAFVFKYVNSVFFTLFFTLVGESSSTGVLFVF